MLTPDQITAIAPDAASLKAGRELGNARKWQSLGADAEALWGLALGSGKEPYQTRVALSDLASKCSCPSRKFPCKHALGLMFITAGDPAALTQKDRPPWLDEWLASRAAREEKSAARPPDKPAKPVDEKAAEARRSKRGVRVREGAALLQQSLADLTREGLASAQARNPAMWENLARRMVDCQAPGLAGMLRNLAESVLHDPHVDEELPLEIGRLHLVCHTIAVGDALDPATAAELASVVGVRPDAEPAAGELVEDEWFVAGRTVTERDRLITSASWLFGRKSVRWARLLRFAPVPQSVVEPWPLGATARAVLKFQAGLYPQRAAVDFDGGAAFPGIPNPPTESLDDLLDRFARALAANPFLRTVPFFIPLMPAGADQLADPHGRALPWRMSHDLLLRVDAICGGRPTPACGEWDGRGIRLLSVLDDDTWVPLTPQHL